MDWKKTFNQGQWVVHSIFIVSIVVGVGATLFAYRLNNLQSTEEAQIIKINSLIQHLKTDNSFDKMAKYLSWAEAEKATDKMRDLTQKIAETEEILEFKASTDLTASMRSFNKMINSNSGMSDPTDALKVLNQKVNNLHDVASSQKYKNVVIIAERMKERLDGLTAKNVGGSVQVSYLKSDLNRLTQLIAGSALTDGEKASLNNRFDSM